MKFVCDRCQTKYSIADEKVRGKILKVRCKACTNIITVREEAPAGAAPRRAPSAAVPTVGPSVARAVAPAARPPAAPAPRPPAPPPAAVPDDGVQWYMALDGNRSGPFTRKQLVDRVAPFSADADLHVWNERLGSWKPPGQVPAIAADLAARKSSGPPPFPGAPRRPTPPPAPALAAAPPRPTGAHAVAAAIGPGVGLKLPPPSGPPGGRRITGPVARPAVLAAAAALAPASSHVGHSEHLEHSDDGLDVDPSTLLETPAPQPHMLHGLEGSNGFGRAHADSAVPNGTPAAADRSDVLNTLNLSAAGASGASPRLLSSEAIVGWQSGTAQAPGARQRSARIILVFLCVIALICVVFVLNMTKKARPVIPLSPKATVAADPMAGIAEKTPEPPPAAPVAPAPVEPVAAAPVVVPLPAASGHGKGKAARGAHGHGASPVAVASAGRTTAAPAVDANARYRDTSRPGLAITGGGGSSRPAPSQSDISRVINNNRGGIKNCYQRALLRDSSLTHGKITVQVTIGISGRVKRTTIDGPPQFRAIDPCIKELVGRWAFPQAGDEYGTEFVYVFQGNE